MGVRLPPPAPIVEIVDVLEVEVRPTKYGDEAVFLINGRHLLEMVRDVEGPMAAAEGSPDIAGAYAPIPAEVAVAPSRHLLGETEPLYSDLVRSGRANKAAVLVCECGEPGCWPFCVRIDVDDQVVRWSDYEQPHRSEHTERKFVWTYEAMPDFTFDRAQYIAAITEPSRKEATEMADEHNDDEFSF
jgi:hypothetical protein